MVAGPLLWLQFIFLVFVGDRMAGVQSTIILTSKIKRDEHLIVAKTTRQMALRMMWGGGDSRGGILKQQLGGGGG